MVDSGASDSNDVTSVCNKPHSEDDLCPECLEYQQSTTSKIKNNNNSTSQLTNIDNVTVASTNSRLEVDLWSGDVCHRYHLLKPFKATLTENDTKDAIDRHADIIADCFPRLKSYPVILPDTNLRTLVDFLCLSNFNDNLVWSPMISPTLFDRCYYEGLIPIGVTLHCRDVVDGVWGKVIRSGNKYVHHWNEEEEKNQKEKTKCRIECTICMCHNSDFYDSTDNDNENKNFNGTAESSSTASDVFRGCVSAIRNGDEGWSAGTFQYFASMAFRSSVGNISSNYRNRVRRNFIHPSVIPVCGNTCLHAKCIYFVYPKLHKYRICLHPGEVHEPRSYRKKRKRFYISVDTCFDEVLINCVMRHGLNWLYPPIQNAFKTLFDSRDIQDIPASLYTFLSQNQSPTMETMTQELEKTCENPSWVPKVNFHSIEIWTHDTYFNPDLLDVLHSNPICPHLKLAAGEIGFSIGTCYASLTGYKDIDSAGTVQLVTLSKLIDYFGFKLWDLGMYIEYKLELGASEVPRNTFVEKFRKCRDSVGLQTSSNSPTSLLPRIKIPINCQSLCEQIDSNNVQESS